MLKNRVEYKRFIWELNNVIDWNDDVESIIFLCIGTNMIIGDAFGPLVGTLLKNSFKEKENVKVIGDLEDVLTYNRIDANINYIKERYKNSLIIVLDSALSNISDIGKIFVQNRGLRYAESLKKHNNTIGNISIKAVVGEDTNNSIENFKILKKVSIGKIQEMSNFVSNGIIEVVNKKENIGKNIYK